VERIGFVLRAQRGEMGDVTVPVAVASSLKSAVTSEWPLNPLLIAQVEQNVPPFSDTPLFAIASRSSNGVRLLITDKQRTGTVPLSAIPSASNDTRIILPGRHLATLPRRLQLLWNQQLRTNLGFVQTTPDIVAALSQHSVAAIVMNDQATAIGTTTDDDSFSIAVAALVQSEERHGRLIRNSFRLPDGTRGFEWVPGPIEPVFQESIDGCRAPITGRTSLWLCHGGGGTFLGTDFDTTESLANDESTIAYSIKLNSAQISQSLSTKSCHESEDLSEKIWCKIESAELSGGPNRWLLNIEVDSIGNNRD
jgi:hypothetical protein